MPARYNRLSGTNLDRLAALSDGVFAVAMTLLVLDLAAPTEHPRHQSVFGGGGSEHRLLHDLVHTTVPHLLPYVLSFMTLGIFWLAQQTQFEHFQASDRGLAWIHVWFLFVVTLLPFSTSLLANNLTYRTAIGVYWLNLLGLGIALFASLAHADRRHLIHDGVSAEVKRLLRVRIVAYQGFYALAAASCVINTYLAMGLLIVCELSAVVSPRTWFVDRG